MKISPLFLLLLGAFGSATSVADIQDELAASQLEFTFGFYDAFLAEQKEAANVVFSPLSISTAMGLAYAGARGTTAAELADSLHITGLGEQFHAALGLRNTALEQIATPESGIHLRIANGLWVQEGNSLRGSYLSLVAEHYDAAVAPADFSGAPEEAREEINTWIADRTNDRIPELLDAVEPNTYAILVNAIHLAGSWHHPFEPAQTDVGTFHRADGSEREIYMMRQLVPVPYLETAEVQVVAMPFRDNSIQGTADLAALFVLPREGVSLETVEASLDAARFSEWTDGLAIVNSVELHLPRFRVEGRAGLIPTFKRLGVRDAFAPGVADFSGLAEVGPGAIYISDIIHQAFLRMDEAGAEAAAATAVTVSVTSVPQALAEVKLDRPFLTFLWQPSTGTILFAARVGDPDPANVERLLEMRAYFGEQTILANDDAVVHSPFGLLWVESAPWVYHEGLTWLYVSDSGATDNRWWWHLEKGWLWSAPDTFPYIWCDSEETWYYWSKGTTDPAWFYSYASGTWSTEW